MDFTRKLPTWIGLFCFGGWLLQGCATASMVEQRGGSPYQPANEERGGVMRYSLVGWSSTIHGRREDAYKQMFQWCNGHYEVTREWDQIFEAVGAGGIPSDSGPNAHVFGTPGYDSGRLDREPTARAAASQLGTERYKYLAFRCLAPAARPAPLPSTAKPLPAPAPAPLAPTAPAPAPSAPAQPPPAMDATPPLSR